jgi:hypothetical protein
MKNPIKTWLQKRQQKKADKANLKHLSDLAFRERMLNQLEQTGMIAWNVQRRQLFIAQSLSVLFMQDAQRWTAFIQNIHEWLYLRLCNEAWEQYMQQEELVAVREALKKDGNLSRMQIDAIKTARRREIAFSEIEPPKVEAFEFMIIQDGGKPAEPLGVGHYDPNTGQMELATWEEIKPLLQAAQEKKSK